MMKGVEVLLTIDQFLERYNRRWQREHPGADEWASSSVRQWAQRGYLRAVKKPWVLKLADGSEIDMGRDRWFIPEEVVYEFDPREHDARRT